MYSNLRAEVVRKGLKISDLAKEIGLNNTGMSQRMNGKTKFTFDEAKQIKDALGVDMALEELFEK